MRATELAAALLFVASCRNETPRAAEGGPTSTAPAASTSITTATATPPTASQSTAPPTSPGPHACASDGDCVLSTFSGCCACCPCDAPHAMTKAEEREEQSACASMDCKACTGPKPKCAPCVDPAKEGMRARCVDAKCTLVETRAK